MPSKNTVPIHPSDFHFIRAASVICFVSAALLGGMALLCSLTGGSWCWELPRLTAGILGIESDFLTINLPMALVVIGVGLRLHTLLGWLSVVLLLLFQGAMFLWMGILQGVGLRDFLTNDTTRSLTHGLEQWQEAFVLNICLGIICLLFFVYVALPGPRRHLLGQTAEKTETDIHEPDPDSSLDPGI